MKNVTTLLATLSLIAVLPACDTDAGDAPPDFRDHDDDDNGNGWLAAKHKAIKFNTGSYNLHLEDSVRFDTLSPDADVARGQAVFGLDEDGVSENTSEALFEGDSLTYGGEVVSNGRTCFTCHRPDTEFGLGPVPLSDRIPLTDTLFTGIEADAGGDPDAMTNLDQLGLVKYKINRFNPARDADDPYRQVFGWRKSPGLTNIGFAHGFLTDARGRVMFETARGAVFAHTQEQDNRFDDLIRARRTDFDDMEAFMFTLVSDPALNALRDPNDPNHDALVEDPFYTVDLTADSPSSDVRRARKRGKKVFKRYCFGACHNTPNVFNNLSNVEGTANGDRSENFVPFGPAVGRAFNVGVSERNAHNLRFTRFVGPGDFEPIVVPLANADGSTNMHEVEFDIGLAASSGRSEDIGRFKVPQLRNLAALAPYFHDNSAATIEDVVDYFNSDDYNGSQDGALFPIHLTDQQRDDLIEFLYVL